VLQSKKLGGRFGCVVEDFVSMHVQQVHRLIQLFEMEPATGKEIKPGEPPVPDVQLGLGVGQLIGGHSQKQPLDPAEGAYFF